MARHACPPLRNRHDEPVRRLLVPFAVPVAGTSVALPPFPSAPATPAHGVRTVVGAGTLDGRGGIALSAAGDLFVTDTGHWRVMVFPAKNASLFGRATAPDMAAGWSGSPAILPAPGT